MITDFESRIAKMRNGEKIKCPRCESGFFSAVGDPKNTKVFRCDSCKTGITVRIPFDRIKK